MFKDNRTARKAMLRAGVGSTMPMRIEDINRGWEPGVAPEIAGDDINFIIHDDALLEQLTQGAKYASGKDKETTS
jgi:hypothetical protein